MSLNSKIGIIGVTIPAVPPAPTFRYEVDEKGYSMMNPRQAAVIAATFFAGWLAILYAGADHPPPVGFFWLVLIAGVCAVGVYQRAPIYAVWARTRSAGRVYRVLRDGLVAGLATGVFAMLLSSGGEPGIPPVGFVARLIWLAVLGGVGVVNTGFLYFLVTATPRGGKNLPD